MTDFVCGKAHIAWANPKQLLPDWELTKTLRIMKLTVVFLFITALQVSARGLAQEKITLSLNNASLDKVFDQIEAQTGFVFIYKDETIRGKKVSIQVTDATLGQALNICLKGQALSYKIIGKSVAIKAEKNELMIGDNNEVPPFIDVRGRVVNEKGYPVEGVTVVVKGTSQKTLTDKNGDFSLATIEHDATLVFTHVSMESFELKVSGKTELVINLKTKVSALGDVVVTVNTGYQQLPKERVTGSFTQIDNKLFNEQVGTNVLERLQYISNGVGAFPKKFGNELMVRGLSTLTTTIAKPLIILDNFQYQGDLKNINPNDIENITILKDASAGSIWGAQAANGVIVINTKKGQFNQKTKFEINSNVTIVDKPDLFYQKNITSSDFIDVETFLFNKGFYDAQLPFPQFFTFSPVINILDKQKRGIISSTEATNQINEFRSKDVRNDFEKYFYQKAINQQYSFNVRGGSNNIAWILSTGFDKNLTELDGKYKRVNIRIDNSYKFLKNLEANTSVFYTQSNTTTGKTSYGDIVTNNGTIPPYTQLADGNGNAVPLFVKYNQSFIDTFGSGKLLDWKYYPLDDYKYNKTSSTIQDLHAVLGLNYKAFDFLTFSIKYRYERQKFEGKNLQTLESYYTKDLINTFSQIDNATGKVTYRVPKGDILDMSTNSLVSQNFRGQVNFDKSWTNNHIITVLGYEISENISEGSNFRTYGYNGNVLTSVNVDYANTYPHIIYGSQNFIPNPAGFSKFDKKFVSFYGNGAYTFDDKYTLSASVRRDASNLFGVNTNDKWKPLWSIGAAWDVSKESFYKTNLFPYLKLKLTYGYQGNVDPSKVAITTIGYIANNPFTSTPYSVVRNFENPDLKWEQVGMLNVGLEFATDRRVISGSIEFYQKRSTDLYGQSPIDLTTGLGTPSVVKNFGTLKGHGIDLELNSININKQFKWTTNFIFNTYTDKIIKLNDPTSYYAKDVVGGSGFKAIQGSAPYAYFAYKWAKLDPLTGDPQGYMNGQISKDYSALTNTGLSYSDAVYVGRLLPPIFGSLGNTVSWKNFSLTARVIYKFNYYFQRESINYSSLVNNSIGHSDFEKRWQKPGDENSTDVPSFVYPVSSSRETFYQNSEILATKADHIRLQYINVSYDFFKGNNKGRFFERVQTYLVVNNIGIIWRANKYGIDPEYNNSVPAPKSIAVGLKVAF